MRQKIYKPVVFILYLLSFFILCFCIKVRFTPQIYIRTDIRIILLFILCIFIYINGYILVKKMNYDKKILKINLMIYFLIYSVTICTLTLFDEVFGRQGIVIIKWNRELLNLYTKYSFNIIPFKTINLFLSGYLKGIVSFKNFSMNIFGNLLIFMPYGIFLPLIFKKQEKFKIFLLTITSSVIVIELVQFITMSGSCDIDDLILNVSGAVMVFLIFKIKFLRKIVYKIFLFDGEI